MENSKLVAYILPGVIINGEIKTLVGNSLDELKFDFDRTYSEFVYEISSNGGLFSRYNQVLFRNNIAKKVGKFKNISEKDMENLFIGKYSYNKIEKRKIFNG